LQVFSEKTDNLSICKYFVHLQVFGDYYYSYVEICPQFSGFANILWTCKNFVHLQVFCASASFFAKNQQVREFSLPSRFKVPHVAALQKFSISSPKPYTYLEIQYCPSPLITMSTFREQNAFISN
jgi:hypothetical protein